MPSGRTRVRLGRIFADALTFEQALDRIVARAAAGEPGYVLTPNVDHVVLAEQEPALVAAYEECFLSLVDGQPLVWLSRAMRHPLPGKISGSDLVRPLAGRAAGAGLPVYFLGAAEGVGQRAAERLREEFPRLEVAGVSSPPLGFDQDPARVAAELAGVRASGARLVLVALGSPKQERFLHRHRGECGPAVTLGIGASLDFLAGATKRAPRWMSRAGLEWLYRLAKEPRRLAGRYLVRDRAFPRIAARMLRMPREERVFRIEE